MGKDDPTLTEGAKTSVPETADTVAKALADATEKANKYAESTKAASDGNIVFSDSMSALVSGIGDGGKAIASTMGIIGSTITGVFKNLASYPAIALSVMESSRNMFNPLAESSSLMAGPIAHFNTAMKDLIKVQDPARIGFVRLSAGIDAANEAASAYPATLRRMAVAYSVTTIELDEMSKSLQGIPIIMNQQSKVTKDVVGAQASMVSQTGSLIQISKAFGMSTTEATTRATRGYKEFNQTVEDTVRSMASISAASRATGVDRKIADEQIVAASTGLAIFGQKSDAAANTWTTFTKSLKDTVPIQKVGELVKEVTDRIAGMSVQNRAFISMMSGATQGRSAMGGALQMELAMRSPEGMEKHLNALTSTLSQFAGGKIITLEEAAKNPQLEIQFQLQREMLSKVTGITDAQNQNRVLEVLKGVQSGGMSAIDASKEMATLQGEAQTIQEKQLTALERIIQLLQGTSAEAVEWDAQIEGTDKFLRQSSGNDINQRPEAIFGKNIIENKKSSLIDNGSFKYFGEQLAAVSKLKGSEDIKKADLSNLTKGVGDFFTSFSATRDNIEGKKIVTKTAEPPKKVGTRRRSTYEEPIKRRVTTTEETRSAVAGNNFTTGSKNIVDASQLQVQAAVVQNNAAGRMIEASINIAGKKTAAEVAAPAVNNPQSVPSVPTTPTPAEPAPKSLTTSPEAPPSAETAPVPVPEPTPVPASVPSPASSLATTVAPPAVATQTLVETIKPPVIAERLDGLSQDNKEHDKSNIVSAGVSSGRDTIAKSSIAMATNQSPSKTNITGELVLVLQNENGEEIERRLISINDGIATLGKKLNRSIGDRSNRGETA
jgi:hypothetical protein